jgi:hypothetical protein
MEVKTEPATATAAETSDVHHDHDTCCCAQQPATPNAMEKLPADLMTRVLEFSEIP